MKGKGPKRSQKKLSISASSMKGQVESSFARQVAGFIKRYRPALKALAQNAER
jgi:hypothetical protein